MKKSIYILHLILLSVYAEAQYSTLDFRHYSMEDGLPIRPIEKVCQDKYGYIWIAAGRGVVRFDGLKFDKFIIDSIHEHSIIDNLTKDVFCDSKNNIWVSGYGLDCYNYSTNSFTHLIHNEKDSFSLSNNGTYVTYEDRSGNIWAGHWGGASKYDVHTGELKNYYFQDNLFRCICEDADGNIWFGSFTQGAYKFNPRTELFTHYKNQPADSKSIGANNIKEIKCDQSGKVWLASWGGGLKLYDPKNDNFITYRFAKPPYNSNADNIDAICFDSENNFWVGTDVGIFRFDPASGLITPVYTTITENEQNARFVVNSIMADNAQGIWVCSRDGLMYFNLKGNKFRNFLYNKNNAEGISEINVNGIYKAGNKSLYIVHSGSIDLWDRNNNRFIKKPYQNLFFQDSEMRLWINKGSEITVSQPNDMDRIAHRFKVDKNNMNALLSSSINTIDEDTSGHVYILYNDIYKIATLNLKANTIRNEAINVFTPKDWFRNDVRRIDIDAYNNMWLLYWGRYIKYNIDSKKIDTYETSKIGLIDNYDRTIIDRNRNLWFINGMVIEKYDQKADSFSLYSPQAGITGSMHNIFEDNNGLFWIPTNMGICSFDVDKGIFRNYTVNDGLPGNRISECGLYDNEELIVSHERGISVFNPTEIKVNNNIAPVVITHFRLFNKDVANGEDQPLKQAIELTREITLKYYQTVISFEFSVLNYYHPEKNQYAYIMEGFEKDYNYVGNRNIANYTNLDPGEYVFRVKGANNDGVWNEEGTSIKIIILPPFWKTWWFRIMFVLVILFSIFIIFRIRMSSIRKQKQELEKLVVERTAEIRAQSEVLKEVNRQVQEANQSLEERQEEIVAQKEEIQGQAEELKILNSTKDKFFSIIGHDLKNPFYAINGLATLLKEDEGKMLPEQRVEMAAMIEESSKNASSLLENLLTWARSQSAKISFSPESFSVAQIVNECFSLLQVNAEKKNIRLVSEVPSDAFVYADKNMITTVIRNLINNALKFTGEGGTITAGCSESSGICSIYIADTGVGMDDKIIRKLFRIDENVTTRGTSGEGGTGLGLIICKEFTDKNKGRISVESEVGKGSKFIVSLPAGEETVILPEGEILNQSKKIKDAAEQVLEESKLDKFEEEELKKFLQSVRREDNTILIIEDNMEIRMNIKQNLNQFFTIEEAEDGKSGIAKAFALIPDLIISDVMMPGTDGFEVCATLKSDMLTSHIPIILLTARTSEKSKITGINMGADDYINKPFNPRLLIARIKNLILQRRQLRERFSNEFIVKPTDVLISSSEGDFLKKAIEVIEKKIDSIQYSVEDFSHDMSLSYIQLYRKLEALTGLSPVQFIRSIRLKRAAGMLENSDMNINEIALSVGFNDPSYFSKCFNEQFGSLPKKYAQMKKAKK